MDDCFDTQSRGMGEMSVDYLHGVWVSVKAYASKNMAI